ncbi:fatty acid desaturase [Burkholderia sp. BCC0044]|uniref:fatty acid desaturase n=1 Tax=Burkholderia sp. BCC0044 TaxID=2676295 RepID=UPI001FC860F3|nr:fatty acid desaturase [Burkholderia sp. BCC0044]
MKGRDYSLDGPGGKEAAMRGLVSAHWFACKVDRNVMKQLMRRDDWQGLKYLGTWLLLLIGSGVLAYRAWGTIWAVPAFALYGLFYAAGEHGSHELSHGTPFKSRWLNAFFFQLTSFLALHETVFWRWSHVRHHTDTIIVGNDREIAFPRPVKLLGVIVNFFSLKHGTTETLRIIRHAFGSVGSATRSFVPASEIGRMLVSSRIYTLIIVGTVAWCVAIHSILPALFIVLPRFYGAPLTHVFNITQHAGLAEDVLDHRLNTRTVRMNPLLAFMYMNMNYHVEHHMFPMVPFYNLPKLHELIKDQCPSAKEGLIDAYREIIPALWRQHKDPTYYIKRQLPAAVSSDEVPGGMRRTENSAA